MWGYLTEFWNAITSVADYSIEFFQSIGNAVAGAIGNLFGELIINVKGLFVFAGWLFNSLGVFFTDLLLPVRFAFAFLKSFISSAFATPETAELWAFTDEILAVFEAIPYWSVMTMILGGCLLVLIAIATIKQFTKL